MDLNRDELRRELKDIDAENTAAMPRWASALREIVGGGTSLTTDQKAELLGVPSPGRRQLFKFGGAAIVGAAVLAACSDDDKKDDGATGDTTKTTVAEMDIALARTAASLEKLAVDTYAAAGGLLKTQGIKDAAGLFAEHHQKHLDALNAAIKGAGAKEITEGNAAVKSALIDPAVAKAKSEADAVAIALELELAAAQTYTFAGSALAAPSLRSVIMTIGGVEARHAAVLQMVAQSKGGADVFPADKVGKGFFPGTNPLPEGAVLSA